MKKLIVALLVVIMVASLSVVLTACGGTDYDFLIGAIYITSQNDTAGYTYAHHSGITKAMDELGLDREQLIIKDGINDTDTDATNNAIDQLAMAGCDIIIGISYGYMDSMEAKAKQYPDIIFSHGTGYKSNENNMNNYFGRIYQARYLAGIAAGLKAKSLNNPNLGYVAAYTTETAETASGINAFLLGAQSVYPESKLFVKSLNAWFSPDEGNYATELINEYDCCVISQHCDSAQPQMAAQKAGVFGCGYNSDMTKDAPEAHLTATVWHWDVYYKEAIGAAMKGRENFMNEIGEVYYKGLKDGLVGVSPLSKNCVEGTQEAIDAVTELIKNDEWDVFSGVKLVVSADGTIEKIDANLVDNKGNIIVNAGEGSIEDSVITGSMNYLVAGVRVV